MGWLSASAPAERGVVRGGPGAIAGVLLLAALLQQGVRRALSGLDWSDAGARARALGLADAAWILLVALLLFHLARVAQARLAAGRQRYRELFDTIGEGLCVHGIITDAEGRAVDLTFEEMNPAFERHTGLRRADVLGRRLSEVLPGAGPVWAERYGAAAAGGEVVEFEEYSAPLDRHFRVLAYPLSATRVVAVFSDITDRVKSEAALHEQLTQLTLFREGCTRLARGDQLLELANDIIAACRDVFGASLAWLGLAEPDGSVRRLAAFPEHIDFDQFTVRWDDSPLAGGPSGRAIRTGRPVVIDDVPGDPTVTPWREAAAGLRLASACSLPLLRGEAAFGVLTLYSTEPGFFTPARVAVFEGYAQLVAATLARLELVREAQLQAQRLASLRAIDLAILGEQDLARTLDVALDEASRELTTDAIAVLLKAPDSDQLACAAVRGFRDPAAATMSVPYGEGVAGGAAARRETVHIPDLPAQLDRFIRKDLFAAEDFQVYLGWPLVAGGEVVGWLELFHRRPFAAAPEWWAFLDVLAGQIAIAVRNLNLLEDLKRKNQQLSLLATAVQRSGESFVVTNRDGLLVYVNAAFLRLTGYGPDDLRGQYITMLDGEADESGGPSLFEAVLAGGTEWAGELRPRTKDGPRPIVEAVAAPIRDDAGELQHWAWAFHDVTCERRLRDQLARAERLESLGQLAGGVAHDFNNILAVILGLSEAVAETVEPGSEAHADLQEMRDTALRGGRLVHQLLAFSRREASHPEPLDLNRLLREAEKMLRRAVREDIRLDFDLTDESTGVLADPVQMEQVLLNLAVNARDAMPEGGVLTFTTRRAHLAASAGGPPPGAYVCLAVRDSGVGMSREVIDRIFEPFFTTKEAGRGTGLGLATVYGIVQQHGGWIEVDSEPGCGTTFTLWMPAHGGAESAGAKDEEPFAAGAGQVILVVEDEPAVRHAICRMLDGQGYRVIEAAGGAEALKLIQSRSEPIDLILSDVVMPGMSGLDLLERLRAGGTAPRTLFMSGYPHEVLAHHQGPEGAGIRLLAKPFGRAELLAAVADALAD